MRKIILLTVFLLIILSFGVNARRAGNFSADDAYDWLVGQAENGSYNNNIIDTSAAFLAVDAAGGLATSETDYIISNENDNHCWPNADCKIKDSTFAILALHKAGESSYVYDAESWLKKAQTPTLTTGNWWLEIDTSDSGNCIVKYTKGTTEVSKNIDVEAGTFPDCGGGTFFDLKNCLEPGLLNSYASLELYVDCSALSSAKISIAYNSGHSYYLYQEVSETTATLIVKNGCFGSGYKSPVCDYFNSLYAEWILNQIGSSLSSELYLRENYDEKNTVHNALMYLVTQDRDYAGQLRTLQKTDGSWDGSSLNTAFAILALGSESEYNLIIEEAKEWLKTKQQEDGSWDDKVFNTAMVLYSSFYLGAELPSCTDGIENQGERGIDCGGPCESEPYMDDCCDNGEKDEPEDGIDCGGVCDECLEMVCDDDGGCDEEQGEDCHNCPGDCLSCEDLCSDGIRSTASAEEGVDCGGWCSSLFDQECSNVCQINGNCEQDLVEKYALSENEHSQNCPEDCWCGDEICDDYEMESGECNEDCPIGLAGGECGDGYCDEGEDVDCPEDCIEGFCNSDGVCDLDLGEDCDCGDCVGEDFCEEEGGGKGWLWILLILILLALGGGAYFFFVKKKPRKPKSLYGLFERGLPPSKPSSRPPGKPGAKGSFFTGLTSGKPLARKPFSRKTKPKKSKLDEDIDKSIKEAKKLIKGEK